MHTSQSSSEEAFCVFFPILGRSLPVFGRILPLCGKFAPQTQTRKVFRIASSILKTCTVDCMCNVRGCSMSSVPSQVITTSSFARFARSATSPSFAYVSNLVPDSSLYRAATPQLRPLQLLLPDCIDLLQLLLLVCVRFNCFSLIASTSTAPRLHPLQLLLPLIVSTSVAAPRLHASACSPSCSGSQPMPGPNVFEHSSPSSEVQ